MSIIVGVIGCGFISQFHFSGLAKAGAKVAWVSDINPESARIWAAKTQAKIAADYRQILADPAVQAVWVLTSSTSHFQVCMEAIAAGKAVVCEKTLATSADDALAIVRAAQKQRSILFTSYMKRFMPAAQKAKELLPRLGRILSTHIRVHQKWGEVWGGSPGDFLSPTATGPSPCRERLGGGILLAGGSHILDLMVFLLGRPQRVFAHLETPKNSDVEGLAAALFTGPGGVVHWEALMHGQGHIGYLRDGWDEQIEIIGVDGRLALLSNEWNQFATKAARCIHADKAGASITEYDYDPVSPFDRSVVAFCMDIEQGRQTVQTALTGYETDELIHAVQSSARGGQAVDINWRL